MNRSHAYQLMDEKGIDALVATTYPNFTYLTDYYTEQPKTTALSRFWAVLPRDPSAEVVAIIPRINLLYGAQNAVGVRDLRPYGDYFYWREDGAVLADVEQRAADLFAAYPVEHDPITVLIQALEERGLTQDVTIGVDERDLSYHDWHELERRLPKVCLTDAYELFRRVRSIKTPEEVDRIRECLVRTNDAMRATIGYIEEGRVHRDVWRTMRQSMIDADLTPRTVCVGVGPSSIFSYTAPSDHVAAPDDLIKFDSCGIYKGYFSDTARTGVVGQPTAKQRLYYQAILTAQQAACAAVKPGVLASDLFQIMERTAQSEGIPHYSRPSLGHGIGREVYEYPLVAADDHTPLEPGMVINVEAPYFELGFGGMNVEDTILVTESGYEPLAWFDHDLFSVPAALSLSGAMGEAS